MQELSEEDIKYRYITPAIEKSGGDKSDIRMEYFFNDGKIIVRGNKVTRGQAKKADYLLHKENIQFAIVEAKKYNKTVDAGLQKAMTYAQILNVPFAYSYNGKGFIEHDFFTGAEREIGIDKTVEAVSEGQRRIWLVMATGTGKTFTAFQIIWKLMKSKTVNRVLYLADRNILLDQTMTQDFKPFSKIMCKVGNKHINSAYEIFLACISS